MWAPFRLKQHWQGLKRRALGQPRREQAVMQQVLSQTPPNDPHAVLRAMDTFGRTQQFLMNVGDEKAPILRAAFEQSRKGLVVEIGAYCGYSAVLWGALSKSAGGRVISIEQSSDFTEIARTIVNHADLGSVVSIETGVLKDCLEHITQPIDLLFLDHAKTEYLPDLLLLEQKGLITTGTVVIADNTGIGGADLFPYLAHVRDSARYSSEEHIGFMEYSKIPDAVEVSIKV